MNIAGLLYGYYRLGGIRGFNKFPLQLLYIFLLLGYFE